MCLYRLDKKWRFFLQLLEYCYITVQWKYELTAKLLVQGRGEFAVLSSFTTVHLLHSAMRTRTECNDFITC